MSEQLIGVWRVVSLTIKIEGDLEPVETMGPSPKGYLLFTPEGRMAAIITADGRKPPERDEDNIMLMKTLLAYSGRYTVDGNKWITNVDVSFNEVFTSRQLVRYFRIDGDRLEVTTPLQPTSQDPNKLGVGTLTFIRER